MIPSFDDEVQEQDNGFIKRFKMTEDSSFDTIEQPLNADETPKYISLEAKREADMQQRDLEAAQTIPIADSELVYVAKSAIGGLGVFAKRLIPKGTRITTYEGRWFQTSFPIREKTQLDSHVLSLSSMDALDGIRYPEAGKGVASLVNSSRNTGIKPNGLFILINEVLKKTAYIRATKDIQPDTEILVNYTYL